MKKSVLFVSNLAQANLLHTNNVDILKAAHIVSLDLDVSAYLRMLGYGHYEVMDFVSSADLAAIYSKAAALTEIWGLTVETEAQFEGVNPIVMERQILAYMFRDALFAIELFKRARKQLKFEEIILFRNEYRPFVEAEASPDVRTAIWLYLAAENEIEVFLVEPLAAATDTMSRFSRVQIAIKLIVKSATNPLLWHLFVQQFRTNKEQPIVLVVAINEAYRYAAVAQQLLSRLKERFIPFVLGARRQGSVHIPEHNITFNPFGLIPGPSFYRAASFAKRLYRLWQNRISTHPSQLPEIFANPHLRFQFDFFFKTQIPNALENHLQFKKILQRLKPSIAITTPSGNAYQSALMEAAKQTGTRSVIFPHSAIPEGKDAIIPGDYVIVWSWDFMDQWRAKGIPEDHIHVTGLPVSLIENGYKQSNIDAPNGKCRTGGKIILVLLATASVAGVPIVDLRKHVQSLETLMRIPHHLAGKVKVLLKLHPHHDYQHLYESFDISNVEIHREGTLTDYINAADIAVLVNIPTSVYLMPIYKGKPLLFIKTSPCYYDADFMKLGGDMVITQDEDIWPILERALYSATDYKRIIKANQFYRAQIMPSNEDPLDALERVLLKLSSEASG